MVPRDECCIDDRYGWCDDRQMLRLVAYALSAALLGGAGRTQLHVYSYFIHVQPAVGSGRVHSLGAGYCLHGTPADGRADAWYCYSTSVRQGVEPCFSAPHVGYVLCDPSGPPGKLKAVWKLTLTRPLPRSRANRAAGPTDGRPMIVELASGAFCRVPTGTGRLDNGTIRGRPITYGCDPTPQTRDRLVQLVGNPSHHGGRWSILAAERKFGARPLNDNRSRLRRVAMRAAWW